MTTFILPDNLFTINNFISFVIGFFSSLLASWFFTRLYYKKKFKQQYEEAVKRFSANIGVKINRVSGTGLNNIEVLARSIVATRNDLKRNFVNLSSLLNSDLDQLEEEVKRLEKDPYNKTLQITVKKTLEVIDKKWDSKQDQIRLEIGKLLKELGIENL